MAFMQGGELNGVRILDSTTVQEMLTIQYPDLDPSQGLIWYQMNVPGGGTIWGHTGGDFGTSAFIGFDPESEIGVIWMSNGEWTYDLYLLTIKLFEFAERLTGADGPPESGWMRTGSISPSPLADLVSAATH